MQSQALLNKHRASVNTVGAPQQLKQASSRVQPRYAFLPIFRETKNFPALVKKNNSHGVQLPKFWQCKWKDFT